MFFFKEDERKMKIEITGCVIVSLNPRARAGVGVCLHACIRTLHYKAKRKGTFRCNTTFRECEPLNGERNTTEKKLQHHFSRV